MISSQPQSLFMVWNVDVYAGYVLFNAAAPAILHRVQRAVYHELRTEGVVRGHGDHAGRHFLT